MAKSASVAGRAPGRSGRAALVGRQHDTLERPVHPGQEDSSATSLCTSSVSAALQTLGLWVLALTTMRSAMSRSAEAST